MSMRRWSETQLRAVEEAVSRTSDALSEGLDAVLRLPEPPRSRWHRGGVSPRGERVFNFGATLLLIVFAAGCAWSIFDARAGARASATATPVSSAITEALTSLANPSTPFLTDAALRAFTPLRGRSGRLRAAIQAEGQPLATDSLPAGTHLEFAPGNVEDSLSRVPEPRGAGVWQMASKVGSAIRPITDFSVITLRPFSDKRRGRIGSYLLGSWPTEVGRVRATGYVTPSGFIEVTPENQDTYVSDHFRLRDFLTKGQGNVWPKYLVLDTKLIDKLELVLAELEAMGHTTSGVVVMSGFRTPTYNAGGGDPSGRAALSRHMYGDAADIYIDNDRSGSMDDLDGDRRITVRDARVIEAAVDRVERAHPTLIGGTGIYKATPAHGPFIHIDTRGFRARWVE